MNLILWSVAGLLALIYLMSAGGKLALSKEKYAERAKFAEDFSPGALKAIGILELLAAIGLILPAALDIVPVVVPLAAIGLVMLMIGAVITRIRRREAALMLADLALLALAGFVAWGRLGPEPFTS